MPLTLLKALPLARNLLRNVSANINLSYLVAIYFWPGRCPGSFCGPLPAGVIGVMLLCNLGCPAGGWHS